VVETAGELLEVPTPKIFGVGITSSRAPADLLRKSKRGGRFRDYAPAA